MHERPRTSQHVIDLITHIVDSSDAKGLVEYGETIDEAKGYNWDAMCLEETVDGLKYLVKRNLQLSNLLSIVVDHMQMSLFSLTRYGDNMDEKTRSLFASEVMLLANRIQKLVADK